MAMPSRIEATIRDLVALTHDDELFAERVKQLQDLHAAAEKREQAARLAEDRLSGGKAAIDRAVAEAERQLQADRDAFEADKAAAAAAQSKAEAALRQRAVELDRRAGDLEAREAALAAKLAKFAELSA